MSGLFGGRNSYGAELLSPDDLHAGTALISPKGSTWVVTKVVPQGHTTTLMMQLNGAGVLVYRKESELRGWRLAKS